MSPVRILANESSDLANGRKTTAATTLRLKGFKDMGNENLSSCAVPAPAEALAQGWSVIPCGSDKRPLVSSWKPFQQRQATPHELEVWLARKPSAWAIVTGKISKRITLDFDGESGRHTLAKLGLRPHRSTPSGGFHVDFDHPGWHVSTLNSKTKRELGEKWPALDIRADGGYVIFNGKTGRGEYRWLRDPSSDSLEILPNDLRKLLGLLHPLRHRSLATVGWHSGEHKPSDIIGGCHARSAPTFA
jgi:Bifunctional DNA primase/polymerase, N-terminal